MESETVKLIRSYSLEQIAANFCDLMQGFMNEGCSNSLINDDGHWAVVSDGIQNCRSGVDEPLQTSFFIDEPECWKDTPAEALRYYAIETRDELE